MLEKQFKTKKEAEIFLTNEVGTGRIEGTTVFYEDNTEFLKQKKNEEIKTQKQENEKKLVEKLGADSDVNAIAKALNVALENIAKLDPEGDGAKLLEMVNETLNKK